MYTEEPPCSDCSNKKIALNYANSNFQRLARFFYRQNSNRKVTSPRIPSLYITETLTN
jgi:hypothetical protein